MQDTELSPGSGITRPSGTGSRGELRLRREESAAVAEPWFRLALDIARAQGARSLELRAVTSLARALADQGRRDESRG